MFDTSPAALDKGNYWLVKRWGEGSREATLVFCNPRADLIYDHIEPFPMRLNGPLFFTGAALVSSPLPGVKAGRLGDSARRFSEAPIMVGRGQIY